MSEIVVTWAVVFSSVKFSGISVSMPGIPETVFTVYATEHECRAHFPDDRETIMRAIPHNPQDELLSIFCKRQIKVNP